MKLRLISLAALMVFFSSAAFAWNCSDPLAERVAVGTTNPGGTAGDGDGQWFLGTGSEGTKGVYYVCKVVKKGGGNGGSCKGHSCNSTSGSSSNSGSSSTSTSGSSSTATGGSATATGGNSSSGVTNSGNSSNTNTNNNTAQGGAGGAGGSATQGQKQGQSQSSSANNSGGNSANSYSSNTNVAAPQIPVNSAFAPTQIPTVSCFKGFGAGVQTMPVGASFGGGKIDENCRALQTALHAPNRLTYCKLYVNLQDSKKAHITMEDCMQNDPEKAAEVVPLPQPQQPQVIVVPVSNNPTPAPVPVITEEIPLGICTFASKTSCVAPGSDAALTDPARPTSICKEMLAAARRELAAHPGYVIVLTGNRNRNEDVVLAASRANRAKQELMAAGVKSSQIKTEVGTGTARTVKIDLVPVSN
jgi:hypothetical protein